MVSTLAEKPNLVNMSYKQDVENFFEETGLQLQSAETWCGDNDCC